MIKDQHNKPEATSATETNTLSKTVGTREFSTSTVVYNRRKPAYRDRLKSVR